MPTAKVSNTRKAVACRRKRGCIEEHRGQPEPFTRITIGTLPDNALLEIFDFYLDGLRSEWSRSFTSANGRPVLPHEDLWHTLIHVCRRWRCVVFASPQRLNLQLLCTEKRPVKRNMWPELPIVIVATVPKSGRPRSQGVNNIVAALKQQHNRVCRITILDIPNSLLKKFAAIKTPFSALTHLVLRSTDERAPVLLDSFLQGSAPRLETLWFYGIPFPALGKLLLSTRHLSTLRLDNIPHPGYISPDALVSGFSGLTGLKTLVLRFQSPRSRATRESRVPPLMPVGLPTLSFMEFKGDSEYLEDMLSRMNIPLQVQVSVTFFNQLVFHTPLLRNHINRTETLREFGSHRGNITFFNHIVYITLFQKHGVTESKVLELGISCRPSDWQLSSLAQLIRSSIPALPALKLLELRNNHPRQRWQGDMENAQWLELFRPFPFVTDLVLSARLVGLVAPALGELTEERVAEEVPSLENISVQGSFPSGPLPWQKEFGQFIAARQISGLPVAVHYSVNTAGDA